MGLLLEIVFVDPHQTGFVGKGSDHLQLIKLWPSRTPGKGVCGRAKFFGSTLLQPARSACVSECFFESRTIRYTGYGFLLVFYSNFVPKMHHFFLDIRLQKMP